jgi:hypothetical protein
MNPSHRLGSRCIGAALLAVAAVAAAPTLAQEVTLRPASITAARTALGPEVHSNLRIQRDGAPVNCRVLAEPHRVELNCADGNQPVVAIGYLPVADWWHLIAAALSPGSLEQLTQMLDSELPLQGLGYDTVLTSSGDALVYRIGSTRLAIAVDAHTSLVRQIRWRRDNGLYELTVLDRSDATNDWYPAECIIKLDGQTWGSISVTDVAANERDLAPLQQADILVVPAGAPRFPRLPL